MEANTGAGYYPQGDAQAASMQASVVQPGYPQQAMPGYPQQQQQQQQPIDPMALRAQREGTAAQGAAVRSEYDTLATDRMTLEHQAKLLKMQEKQKKKEGKKLGKKEKELGKQEMRAMKKEAERKVLAGEILTPEEQRALISNVSDDSGDEVTRDKKSKKKSDKRVKEIRKELMEIDFKIDKLLMEKQQLHQELSTTTGEPMPGVYGQGGQTGAPMGSGH